MSWETDTAARRADEASPLTVRDVVRAPRRRVLVRARARAPGGVLPLPAAAGQARATPLDAEPVLRGESRPEYYDFDLFRRQRADARARRAAPGRPGLHRVRHRDHRPAARPTATRSSRSAPRASSPAKLRRQECFEQLVDPQRSIPAAGIPIHGITPEMVRGPADDRRRAAGLPRLRAATPCWWRTTRPSTCASCSSRKSATGLRFDQPVLDTLLLSAVVHPQQASHRLEAIAERLGVTVLGRHTALGDAMVTAEVFLKMIPLLRGAGHPDARAGARGGAEDVLRAGEVLTVWGLGVRRAGVRRHGVRRPGVRRPTACRSARRPISVLDRQALGRRVHR